MSHVCVVCGKHLVGLDYHNNSHAFPKNSTGCAQWYSCFLIEQTLQTALHIHGGGVWRCS
jgi:fatty-acid desaturase